MFQLNLNFFALLSIFTALFSLFFAIYSLVFLPFRKSSFSFSILSFIIFIMSVGNIFMLQMMDYQIALSWSYPLAFGIHFMPIALLIFVCDFYENGFSKLNKFLKTLAYIPAIGVVLWMFLSGHINVSSSMYGYVFNMPHLDIIGIAYLMPIYLLILLIIANKLYKNSKVNKSNRTTVLFLVGIGIFVITNAIYHPLVANGLVTRIPVNSLLSFFLYIFITVGIWGVRMSAESLSMREIFENVEDCIFITNNKGRIVKINESMYRKLFGDTPQLSSKKIIDEDVKSVISSRIKDRDSYQKLFKYIEDDSSDQFNTTVNCSVDGEERTYNINISPIKVKNKKRIGKLAIFRDITEIQNLQDKLREQSIKDFLTNIYNLRYFYGALGREIQMFNRYKGLFCLLMIDVDNFKKFNDSWGHLKGDEILRMTADLLKSNIREEIDVAARYGGDEFAVILVNTVLQDAKEIAGRMLDQYNGMNFNDISLSIGVSQYEKGMNSEGIIKSADKAMYQAKALGGNRVVAV